MAMAERLTAEDAAKGRGEVETFRTSGGLKVTVSALRRITPEEVVTALKEALGQAADCLEVA